MRVLDLFSGIGGFRLAGEWLGHETVAFAEVDPFCQGVLKERWPTVPNLGDVRKLCRRIHHNLDETGDSYDDDWVECAVCGEEFGECECIGTDQFVDEYGHIDCITAGVPCQPASIIGKRKGAEDSRWLWPDTLRIVEELQPKWFIGENPTGLLTLDGGRRFGGILRRLSEAGYVCWWETLPASSAGWGHRRERVWIVAYSGGTGLEGHAGDGQECGEEKSNRPVAPPIVPPFRDTAWWWKDQCPVPVVVDGVSDPSLWKQGVIATGNAIVPQVAYCVMKGMK